MMQLAASLPVVGLPVPEQQVSEPVPRGQGKHILLQFDHRPPPYSPNTDKTANCTSTPRRWTLQKPTSLLFLLLFQMEINNAYITWHRHHLRSKRFFFYLLLSVMALVTMWPYFSSRRGNRSSSSVGALGRLHFYCDSYRATGCLSHQQHPPSLSYA